MNASILRKPFPYAMWNATLVLVVANVAAFILSLLVPDSFMEESVVRAFASRGYVWGDTGGLTVFLALNPVLVGAGWVWQFVTYMFMHAGFDHLLFNMLGLYIFGEAVEQKLGSREFLLFYFLVGILSGAISWAFYLLTGMEGVFLMGASGAIFGIMLAYAVIFPWAKIYVFGLLPLPAPILILLYTGYSVLQALFNTGSTVAHLTHLAGFVVAFAYFPARFGVNPVKRLTMRP